MRIWQGSLFSSPVFLSHHLFGCARIHWNVFTRCQNSGNSTGFGSRERKNKVITGGVWEREPGGVSVTITEETIYSVRESKVSFLLSGTISDQVSGMDAMQTPFFFNESSITWYCKLLLSHSCAQPACSWRERQMQDEDVLAWETPVKHKFIFVMC